MQSIATSGLGYVYVKAHKNSRGLHKIGLTRHPEQREKQLGGTTALLWPVFLLMIQNGWRTSSIVNSPMRDWMALNGLI